MLSVSDVGSFGSSSHDSDTAMLGDGVTDIVGDGLWDAPVEVDEDCEDREDGENDAEAGSTGDTDALPESLGVDDGDGVGDRLAGDCDADGDAVRLAGEGVTVDDREIDDVRDGAEVVDADNDVDGDAVAVSEMLAVVLGSNEGEGGGDGEDEGDIDSDRLGLIVAASVPLSGAVLDCDGDFVIGTVLEAVTLSDKLAVVLID